MSKGTHISRFLYHPEGQGEHVCLTPAILAHHFKIEGRNVVWENPVGKKAQRGGFAGCNIQSQTVPKHYGVKIGFHGHLLRAEEVAFAIHHGRFHV